MNIITQAREVLHEFTLAADPQGHLCKHEFNRSPLRQFAWVSLDFTLLLCLVTSLLQWVQSIFPVAVVRSNFVWACIHVVYDFLPVHTMHLYPLASCVDESALRGQVERDWVGLFYMALQPAFSFIRQVANILLFILYIVCCEPVIGWQIVSWHISNTQHSWEH